MANKEIELSSNDEAILNKIFCHVDATSSSLLENTCYHQSFDDILDIKDASDCNETKKLEFEGIKCAENNDFQGAINLFSKAINIDPQLASPYNNRAQVYRILQKDDDAMLDIEKAIRLSNENDAVYCKALCQRAILHFKHRRDVEAVQDFQKAASLGSEFAKEQMVKLNPYATLCNATLKKVFESLKQ